MNICLNGNGDLAKEAFGDALSGNAQNLEKLYNVSNTLTNTKSVIESNRNSIAIKTVNDNLNNLKVNFPATTDASYGSDAMINQFAQYNLFTDSNIQGTYQKGCGKFAKDFWSTNLDSCKSGYVKANTADTPNGDPNCLIFNEWNANAVASRYNSVPSGCSSETGSPDFNNIQGATNAYFSAFTQYSNANSALIDDLQRNMNDLDKGFSGMSDNLLKMLRDIDGIIRPLVDIFQGLVGNAGLFQLVNCSKNLFADFFFKFFFLKFFSLIF